MPRPDKVQAVEDIKVRWESAQATFLTEYRGMTVAHLRTLRRNLKAAGADYKVVKMTLARLAAGDLGLDEIQTHLTGPTGITFANGDPVAVAKALRDFARDNDRLVIKVGLLGRSLLAPEQVSKLADIEPREVLLSKIAGAAKAPLANMAGLLAAFTRNAATLFSRLLDKKGPQPETTKASDEVSSPTSEHSEQAKVADPAAAEADLAAEAAEAAGESAEAAADIGDGELAEEVPAEPSATEEAESSPAAVDAETEAPAGEAAAESPAEEPVAVAETEESATDEQDQTPADEAKAESQAEEPVAVAETEESPTDEQDQTPADEPEAKEE